MNEIEILTYDLEDLDVFHQANYTFLPTSYTFLPTSYTFLKVAIVDHRQ